MKLMTFSTFTLCLFFLKANAHVEEPQNILWKTDTAVANGTGCQMGENIEVITAGDQIQVIYSDMGIRLPARSGLPFAQRKSCSIAMSVTTSPGIYPKSILQTLNYGGNKSANATAAIAGQTTLFGIPLEPFSIILARGTIFDTRSAELSLLTPLSADTLRTVDWCSSSFNSNGLISLRSATQGVRDSDSEDLIIEAEQYDLKYASTFVWARCPYPEQ
ncbi:MAG: hypothetical protein ACO3A4_07820 [Silvanigrellaceae bacterium]